MLHNNHLFSFYYLGQLLIQPVLTEYQFFTEQLASELRNPKGQIVNMIKNSACERAFLLIRRFVLRIMHVSTKNDLEGDDYDEGTLQT